MCWKRNKEPLVSLPYAISTAPSSMTQAPGRRERKEPSPSNNLRELWLPNDEPMITAMKLYLARRRADMHIALLLKGLVIGLSIAATVGPMSMLCIQRTLERGRLVGMLSGLGIATADGLYALVAGLGLTAIMHLLISQQFWIRLIGGLFLVYLGLKTILTRVIASAAKVQERTKKMTVLTGLLGIYLSMLLLTLTNPLTILSFIVIFAGVGLGTSAGSGNALLLVLGVFLGSVLWWLILTSVVSFIRTKLNARLLLWINRASGAILLAFGIAALVSVIVS